MSRLLRRDIELACDRAVVSRLSREQCITYAKTLITLATKGEGPSFSRAFGHKLTEERILAIMNYKKLTALGLALTILLVSGVTVAFATEPVTPQPDPAPAVTEAAENIAPELTEEELDGLIEKSVLELLGELDGEEGNSAAQSACRHLSTTCIFVADVKVPKNDSVHRRYDQESLRCNHCQEILNVRHNDRDESHTFGEARYISSNHSSLDPSNHTYTYSHTCLVCHGDYQYTVPSGCRKGNCVDPYSLTPEAEVQGTPADAALCDGTDCGLPYEHYHYNGEVVVVESPDPAPAAML